MYTLVTGRILTNHLKLMIKYGNRTGMTILAATSGNIFFIKKKVSVWMTLY